ncbi:MAG TPA: D-2-hydroxyacid dehydrogenase [Terriglobia bacterium]|nr:D-2-hydroxyacid dehydrogenase [Terriglobia bacterium]
MNVMIFTVWPVAFWQTPKSQVERLRKRFPEISFRHALTDDEASLAIETTDIALASRLSAAMVERAPRLRWVHSTAAAVANLLPLDEFAARGIIVTNSRGIQAVPIAEHVMGGLLVLARRFNVMFDAQRDRRWIQNDLTRNAWPWSLQGRKMTILGLGTIGQEVARRAHAFGMSVTGIRRRLDQPVPAFVERMVGPDRLRDALSGCDVLVISAPFISGTDGLIGTKEIELLNGGAIIINVARGKIVDEAALITAIQSGHLGGAVLDVFESEPLDRASSLWSLPNVIISPHSAGVRPDHWDEVIDLFSENLRRFQRGEPLLNMVNCDAGY